MGIPITDRYSYEGQSFTVSKKGAAVAERSYAPDWELGCKVVGSITADASNFSSPDCKKINNAPSVRVKVISCDHS